MDRPSIEILRFPRMSSCILWPDACSEGRAAGPTRRRDESAGAEPTGRSPVGIAAQDARLGLSVPVSDMSST
jgi:hypothetical protein